MGCSHARFLPRHENSVPPKVDIGAARPSYLGEHLTTGAGQGKDQTYVLDLEGHPEGRLTWLQRVPCRLAEWAWRGLSEPAPA